MKMRPIATTRPTFSGVEIDAILREVRAVLESGQLTMGPRAERFERDFAALVGVRHAIAVASGTHALEIAYRHYAREGDEIVVPTNTFLATATAAVMMRAMPVLVDIDPETLCISVEAARAAITSRTRIVVAVHVAGLVTPQIEELRQLCSEKGLVMIEDAAHAHGASANGAIAGSLGHAGAFSFFPTKPMTTAEGGMITTNDDDLAAFARSYRGHGVDAVSRLNEEIGVNARLDELRAILGQSQVRTLADQLAHRRLVARRYEERLRGMHGCQTFVTPAGFEHSFYKFPVLLASEALCHDVARLLAERGIATGNVYWPACHNQPIVKRRPDLYLVRSAFPAADSVLPRVLCLPIHASLTLDEVDHVTDSLQSALRELST